MPLVYATGRQGGTAKLVNPGGTPVRFLGPTARRIADGDPRIYAAEYGLVLWARSSIGVTINNAAVASPEDFSSADWTATNVTVTANQTTDPTGGSGGDLIADDATAGNHSVSQTVTSGFVASRSTNVSVFAKDNGAGWLAISLNAGALVAWFNLATGVVGTKTGFNTTTTVNILPAGNGWYQCSLTHFSVAAAISFHVTTADATLSYSGSGLSIYLWRARAHQPKVSAATDLSGTGNDLVQATGTAQPQYLVNDANGYPTFTFSSASMNLGKADTNLFGSGAYAFLHVVRHPIVVAERGIFSNTNAAGNAGMYSGTGAGSERRLTHLGVSDGADGAVPTRYEVIEASHESGVQPTMRVNGVAVALTGPTGVLSDPGVNAGVRLGLSTAGKNGAFIRFGELIVFTSALPDHVAAALEARLRAIYAI